MKKSFFFILLLCALNLSAQTIVSVGASDTTVVSVMADSNKVDKDVKEAISSLKVAMKQMKAEWDELDKDERETIFSVIEGGSKLTGLISSITAIAIVLVVFGIPALVVFLIIYFIYKNRQNRYKVMEAAYAAGKDVPRSAQTEMNINYMKEGVRKVALGIGLSLLFWAMSDSLFLTSIGFLIICIGAGEIVCGMLDNQKNHHDNDSDDNTPPADSTIH
ncbi:MAG: DUF6249 domain-containing protein [Bacteroidales bacterium]|nr:DUF6249 domain-containing protein [Bacteroidales bacterium]